MCVRKHFSVWVVWVGALALFASPGAAATIAVNWGGNYMNDDIDLALQKGGFDGSGNPLVHSPVTTGANPYTGGIFYGSQVAAESSSNNKIDANGALVDRFELRSGDQLFLWKQQDFLNGLNTGNAGFESDGKFKLEHVTFYYNARVVVRLGSTYYISNAAIGNDATVTPTALMWYAYNPASSTSTFGATDLTTSVVVGGKISNVKEVGFFTPSSAATRISDVIVQMSAVPEPAAMSLLGLGGLALLRRRR